MNILLLNWRDPRNPKSGGAEYVTHIHAKAWIKSGDSVTWFTSSFKTSVPIERLDGIEIVRKGNILTVFLHAFLFYMKHRREYDLVVDQAHGIPFFSVLYAKVPVVLFIHEVAGDIWDIMHPFPIAHIGRFLERMALRLYTKQHVWTDAPSTRRELISLGVDPTRCVAIGCAVSRTSMRAAPKKPSEGSFAVVGRIVPMKRVEDVICAFSIIRANYPKSHLAVVGDGDEGYIRGLKALATRLGLKESIVWHGAVSEKQKYDILSDAHVLLHASVKEGWGLVVLEAASVWTPSVVYGVSGLVDTVKDHKTGVLVQDQTPEALARATLSLIGDKKSYARMQKNAALWNDTFTWKELTEKSYTFLHSCI